MSVLNEWPSAEPSHASYHLEGGDVKSCRRTLEIFEFFAEHQRPLSMLEISAALKYPQSSTSSLLKTLTGLGYIEYQRDTRLYRPTIRLGLVAACAEERFFGNLDALLLMRNLARATGLNAVLGIQNGIFVQYLLRIDGCEPGRIFARGGVLRPICKTAIGLAFLSRKTDSEIHALVSRANLAEEPGNRAKIPDVMAAVDLCRRTGLATSRSLVDPDIEEIAALLPLGKSSKAMAIGVLADRHRLNEDRSAIEDCLRAQLALALADKDGDPGP